MWHSISIILRWLTAAAILVASFRYAVKTMSAVEAAPSILAYSAAFPLLVAMGGVILSVLFVAPELIHWGGTPIRAFFDAILYPHTEIHDTPPDYTLPHFYYRQRRYPEALEWYLKLLRAHPREARAYMEAIATAFEGGEPRLAHKLLRKARRKVRDAEALAKIEAIFRRMQRVRPTGFTAHRVE